MIVDLHKPVMEKINEELKWPFITFAAKKENKKKKLTSGWRRNTDPRSQF